MLTTVLTCGLLAAATAQAVRISRRGDKNKDTVTPAAISSWEGEGGQWG